MGKRMKKIKEKGRRRRIYIYIIMDLAFLACVFTRMGLFILKNVFLKFFLESPLIFVLLLKRKKNKIKTLNEKMGL